ncbi:MAG: hypothetical protein GXO67_01790 [Archaeoglobi archaeon]|nr:hypothetical protein [Archaeoglobi archaeon]
MKYRFAGLAASILATYVAVTTFAATRVYSIASMILSPDFAYLLFAVPVVSFLAGRRVFGTGYLTFLLLLSLTPMLSDSEVFEGIVDSLYYLGFESFSRSLADLFPFRDSLQSVLLVSMLYIASSYFERLDEYEREIRAEGFSYSPIPTAVALVAVLFAVYTLVQSFQPPPTPSNLIYGLAAAFLLVISLAMAWWWR